MCKFISWIEKEGKVYFLTDRDLATKEGKELIEYCNSNDLKGHGAIRKYYGLEGGENKEYNDLSDPNKFPKEIQKAIKEGMMCEFEPVSLVIYVLTDTAQKEYGNKTDTARKEYYYVICIPVLRELIVKKKNRVKVWK